MAVTFSGLASGMDTDSIVSALMEIERAPIDRLENDQTYFSNRLNAFSKLNDKLKTFLEKAEAIDSATELDSAAVESSSDEFFSVTSDSKVGAGSYSVTVFELAKQQKDVSQGYSDKTAAVFGTGSLSLTVGGVANSISIDSENNSLSGIAEAINEADLGVSATIINDGTDTPYRLVLTGDDVSESFTLDASGLTGGTETNPAMATTQAASQAHIQIDGIDIYSDSNSIDSAVPGLSFDLLKADSTATTTLNVSADNDATTAKIQGFVDAYNGVINFIAEQKDADWGNDSVFRSVKSRMQEMLVSAQSGAGTFSALSQLGLETQRDGTISLNSSTLSEALTEGYDSVVALLTGSGEGDGVIAKFTSYLESVTDRSDGLYASRKEITDSQLRRIDQKITSLEARLEHREDTLRAQFSAMEELVSGLSSQGNYLLQQLSMMPSYSNS